MGDWFQAAYPGGCDTALPAHEALYGPAPTGYRYECVGVVHPGGWPGALVYARDMAATYMIQVEHTRLAGAGSSVPEDVAITTHHYRWAPDTPPTDADFAAVEARLDLFWQSLRPFRHTGIVVTGYRWYEEPRPAGGHHPNIRSTIKNIAGTAVATPLPAQIAVAFTEVTDVRRRWGRFYVPGVTTALLASNGMMASSGADNLAAEARNHLMQSIPNWRKVVYGSIEPRSLEVRKIRIDNIFDIQRRRRPDKASHRAEVSLYP